MKPLKKNAHGISLRRKFKMALYPFFIVLCSFAVVLVAFSGSRKIDYVINDGFDTYKVSSYSQNIETVLEENGFSLETITYSTSDTEDGILISISPRMTVSVTCDGQTSLVAVKDGTVKDMISRLGIMLGDDDVVSEPLYAPVRDGMSIQISRVNVEYNTVDMKIEHPISYVENNEMNEGKTEVVAEGRDGLKRVTYKRISVDGILQDFTLSSEETVSEPIEAVVAYGTYVEKAVPAVTATSPAKSSNSSSSGTRAVSGVSSTVSSSSSGGGTITTSSGATYSYSSVINMTATAYTYGSGTNITSSGVPAQVGVVAALPSVLPQGTRVYIVSPYGTWEYGVATVGDCPANNIIDLFMETYDECVQFGVRDALVYILD